MSFEKLRVYVAARKLAAGVDALLPELSRTRPYDAAALARSVTAVPDNIAEAYGVGRPEPGMKQGRKIYHLEIARGSTDETRAQLLRLSEAGVLSPKVTQPLMILARTIAKMLTGLIRVLRRSEPRKPR